ncbi:MAG: biopolymer transport protein ExbD [Gammaproteobacteria bacterium]|jgi:biopolymer transport protein ExbD
MITLVRKRSSAKLSLTPLIDVVFILLIFFMLESDFLRPYVMNLAQQGGGASNVTTKNTPILIELHDDQTVWINKGKYSMDEIENAILELNPAIDSPVVLASDPGVPLQSAVTIIDILQRRGLLNIALTEAERFN